MIMIDGTPAPTLAARMRELGLIGFRTTTPPRQSEEAYRAQRRAKQRECMARLRAKRREMGVAA